MLGILKDMWRPWLKTYVIELLSVDPDLPDRGEHHTGLALQLVEGLHHNSLLAGGEADRHGLVGLQQ